MPNGLSAAQAAPCAVGSSPRRPIFLIPTVAALFPSGNGTAEFSIPARRDPVRRAPGAQRYPNVASVRSQGRGLRSAIRDPARQAAPATPTTRPPRHRSNHRRFHRLRDWLPPIAIAPPLQCFRAASTSEAPRLAPASFFPSRLHPQPARTPLALGLAFPPLTTPPPTP